jgi:hypothetical protein
MNYYSYLENNCLYHNNIEYDSLSESFNQNYPYLNRQSQDISNFVDIDDYPWFNINKNNQINFEELDLSVDLSNKNNTSKSMKQSKKKYSNISVRHIKNKIFNITKKAKINKIKNLNTDKTDYSTIKETKINNFINEIYIPDIFVKKIKMLILKKSYNFINEKIIKIFNNDIGKGICIKQLLPINKFVLYHSSVEEDKEFLNKKLKEIFSSISNKYTSVLNTKNKNLIDDLINLEEHGKYFKELFELSFLDCLEHIRGTKNSELLDELPKIDDIINNEGILDEDEINIYKDVINNYELIIEKKKKRRTKKTKKNEK